MDFADDNESESESESESEVAFRFPATCAGGVALSPWKMRHPARRAVAKKLLSTSAPTADEALLASPATKAGGPMSTGIGVDAGGSFTGKTTSPGASGDAFVSGAAFASCAAERWRLASGFLAGQYTRRRGSGSFPTFGFFRGMFLVRGSQVRCVQRNARKNGYDACQAAHTNACLMQAPPGTPRLRNEVAPSQRAAHLVRLRPPPCYRYCFFRMRG